ncbi:MAG: hypothetical protein ACYDGR_15725 [Candidatus Dormibacteria bacterium]
MRGDHLEHLYLGEPDEDLVEWLEPDQLVAAMEMPVGRRTFSRRVAAGLLLLRIFLLLSTAMVIYAFVSGVLRGSG